jgi:hypothetical protein
LVCPNVDYRVRSNSLAGMALHLRKRFMPKEAEAIGQLHGELAGANSGLLH